MFKQIVLLILINLSLYANIINNNKSLDIPKEYTKYIIKLPKLVHEENYKVELLIGKKMFVDTCNEYRFDGKIEEKSSYLYINYIGAMKSLTHLKCQGKKKDRFIHIFLSDKLWKNYNSQSSIVIYLPKWYEVKYKIWEKYKNIQTAIQK